jgi:hypothetical protein
VHGLGRFDFGCHLLLDLRGDLGGHLLADLVLDDLRHVGHAHRALVGLLLRLLARRVRRHLGFGLRLRVADHGLGLIARDHAAIDQRLDQVDHRVAELREVVLLSGSGGRGRGGGGSCLRQRRAGT